MSPDAPAANSPYPSMWGRYEYNVDSQGRTTIPTALRPALGATFILTLGPARHLRAYPVETWESFTACLGTSGFAAEMDPNRAILQRMAGTCERLTMDGQGRVIITKHFRDWADLKENEPVYIIGTGPRIEIWSRAIWLERAQASFTEANSSAAALSVLEPKVEPAFAAVAVPATLPSI